MKKDEGAAGAVPLKVISPGGDSGPYPPVASPGEAMVESIVARLLAIAASLDRQDSLETSEEFAGWFKQFSMNEKDARSAALELIFRAMRAVADRTNYRILQFAIESEGSPVPEFCEALGMERIGTVERIHDLVQAGILAQDLISGAVQVTPLGQGLFGMVDDLASRAGGDVIKRLSERLD